MTNHTMLEPPSPGLLNSTSSACPRRPLSPKHLEALRKGLRGCPSSSPATPQARAKLWTKASFRGRSLSPLLGGGGRRGRGATSLKKRAGERLTGEVPNPACVHTEDSRSPSSPTHPSSPGLPHRGGGGQKHPSSPGGNNGSIHAPWGPPRKRVGSVDRSSDCRLC
jgi:hypothetical protein